MILLHLVTQRDQPYGSVRKCCERCGDMLVEGTRYTDSESVYNAPPDQFITCEMRRKDREMR